MLSDASGKSQSGRKAKSKARKRGKAKMAEKLIRSYGRIEGEKFAGLAKAAQTAIKQLMEHEGWVKGPAAGQTFGVACALAIKEWLVDNGDLEREAAEESFAAMITAALAEKEGICSGPGALAQAAGFNAGGKAANLAGKI